MRGFAGGGLGLGWTLRGGLAGNEGGGKPPQSKAWRHLRAGFANFGAEGDGCFGKADWYCAEGEG